MNTQTMTPEYLNREEAAAYLHVAKRTISDLQRRRIIPHIRLGVRCVRFRRADLDEVMSLCTVRAEEG